MSKRLLNAISFRIGLIFSLSVITILVVMGFVIHQQVVHHFENQNKNQILGKIELVQNILRQNPDNTPELNSYLKDALVGHHELYVQVERPLGHTIFNSGPTLHDIPSTQNMWTNWKIQETHYQGYIYQNTTSNTPQLVRVIIGIDRTEHLLFLTAFRQHLFIIGLIGTLCLMLLGSLAAWRGLRPVEKMAEVTTRISAQHLSERLKIENTPTELRSLSIAFNEMLDRLEMALAKLSDFSSDLAHEMRTPLNNLMTQTQVCLSRSRDVETYKEVLFSNLEELERLAKMVSDMLFLAKAEYNLNLNNLKEIDLTEEVSLLFDFYDAIAADKNIKLHYTGTAKVIGDPSMLRRAFSNLLSNAIKYAQANSTIFIKLEQHASSSIFTIQNEGVTLLKDQQARLFDRFYRVDTARQRKEDGTGLGLAITKSIIDAHAATIHVESDHGLIRFVIQFKNSPLK
ncbi:heavy metal sensor histidine kinase [Acinetobacter suaedae]|uniref:Sensor protein n=1 Tax=Acinetobacter suaedae TaxID=2609668 RepID=A0A5P1URY4_9GAMM|nr:heavy metal sensor histidine kinase [Acinetobacter sp. C16S1]QER39681.1 heavy metal sensor histidine kinase [Acinetobacter sp. C16S1]